MSELTKAELRQRLGNISQLQDLLFGEQIEQYNYQLEQQEHRIKQLETSAQQFTLDTEEQLQQLETKLLHRIDSIANSFEKKLKYLNFKSQEKHQEIKHELDTLSKNSYETLDFLQTSLNTNTTSLKAEINQAKSAVDRDLQLLKQQIIEKIEFNLSKLSEDKVSRTDLAEVLFEMCLKLKGTDVDPELPEETNFNDASDNHANGELMLPETQTEEHS